MSNVLRPVGPEPAQTYWLRRAAVMAAAVVIVAVIAALIVNGTSSGSAVQASPPPPTLVVAETATPTPTPSATPAASASPTAAGATTAAPTTAAPTTSELITTAPTAAAPTTTAPTTTAPTVAPSRVAATKTSPPPPARCVPSSLRPTLTGKQQLKPKETNTFRLSMINGSGQTCVASVTRANFELKIYSGSDRIWSTRDCATIVKAVTRKLAPEQAVEWSLSWNGRRSRAGCQSRPEIPRPGTYYATAQLSGAEPVRLRMILRG